MPKLSDNVQRFFFFAKFLLIPLLGMAVYYSSFHASFQLDDYPRIIYNPAIQHWTEMQAIWGYSPSRFLAYWSFAVNYHFGQVDPFGYHLVNFILHLLMTLGVYVFARLTLSLAEPKEFFGTRREFFAFLTALIFLVHPIQTSAVTYVVQRSTLLAAIFYLWSVIFYILFRTKNRNLFYLCSIVMALAGVVSKPFVATLPLAILLYEFCFFANPGRWAKRILICVSVYFLVPVLVLSVLNLEKYNNLTLAGIMQYTGETGLLTRQQYFFTQCHVILTYIRLLFLPINQNLDYDYPVAQYFFSFPTFFSFCAMVAFALLAVKLYRRQRIISFAILWFFVTLASESSFVPIADVIFEHRLYLPIIGFALIVPVVLSRVLPTKRMFAAAMTLIVLVLSILSIQRNDIWSNRIEFLKDMAQKSPNKARVHSSLGVAYAEEGKYPLALMAFERALELDPNDLKTYNNRANTYRLAKKHDLALADYNRVLALDPKFEMGYFFRSQMYAAKGDFPRALADALEAKKLGMPGLEEYITQLRQRKDQIRNK